MVIAHSFTVGKPIETIHCTRWAIHFGRLILTMSFIWSLIFPHLFLFHIEISFSRSIWRPVLRCKWYHISQMMAIILFIFMTCLQSSPSTKNAACLTIIITIIIMTRGTFHTTLCFENIDLIYLSVKYQVFVGLTVRKAILYTCNTIEKEQNMPWNKTSSTCCTC